MLARAHAAKKEASTGTLLVPVDSLSVSVCLSDNAARQPPPPFSRCSGAASQLGHTGSAEQIGSYHQLCSDDGAGGAAARPAAALGNNKSASALALRRDAAAPPQLRRAAAGRLDVLGETLLPRAALQPLAIIECAA